MKAREYYRIYSSAQYKVHKPLGVPKTLLNSCPALSWAAQSVTQSHCLCKTLCLALRSVFMPVLLQKHVQTGCNLWGWEKESKGAGCITELHRGGDLNSTGGRLAMRNTRASCAYVTLQMRQNVSNLTAGGCLQVCPISTVTIHTYLVRT